MPDTTVRYFASSMAGAPALSGQAGTLIAVLDACLVNGFGSVTLDSLVVSGGVATATKSTGHGFQLLGGVLGTVIKIAGASPSGLNGDWRIASQPSASVFTFACPGISDQTASGTITAKMSPGGWSKAFSGTNKAVYQSADVTATQMYWRVDDTTAQYAGSSAYESMSGVDTGTSFATGRFVIKSKTADATARSWIVIANPSMIYVFIDDSAVGYWEPHYFGDILPFKVDAYRCLLAGTSANTSRANSANPLRFSTTNVTTYNTYVAGRITLARSYTNVAGGVSGSFGACACLTYLSYAETSDGYLHQVQGGAILDPVNIYQGPFATGGVARGVLPGAYSMRANLTGALAAYAIEGDRLYVGMCIGYASQDSGKGNMVMDITGPWS